jgi:hypothetical protein
MKARGNHWLSSIALALCFSAGEMMRTLLFTNNVAVSTRSCPALNRHRVKGFIFSF